MFPSGTFSRGWGVWRGGLEKGYTVHWNWMTNALYYRCHLQGRCGCKHFTAGSNYVSPDILPKPVRSVLRLWSPDKVLIWCEKGFLPSYIVPTWNWLSQFHIPLLYNSGPSLLTIVIRQGSIPCFLVGLLVDHIKSILIDLTTSNITHELCWVNCCSRNRPYDHIRCLLKPRLSHTSM